MKNSDMRNSDDGGVGIASGCKPEEEGFDSPSSLPIKYNEVKPGLWISEDNIFTIQAKVKMISQEEIEEVLAQIDNIRKGAEFTRRDLVISIGFFMVGSIGFMIIRYLLMR